MSLAGSSGSRGFTPASAEDDLSSVPGGAEPASPPIRRLAGRFLLEQHLRAAADADVWLALDEKLNRAVAVYLMGSGVPTTSEVLVAARLAAGVPDTRFVQVLDAVDDGTCAYVVTEWLTDAVDLATGLATGPMTSWDAVAVASEVAEAMASAHASGLTHQRLDPYNVLRTESGQVKIHGLRLEAALSGQVPASVEEARAADVRGIGALLYACLTGHWPHGEAYGLAAAPQDALGPTSPASLRPEVPLDVDSVTMRLLSAGVPLADATPPPAPGEEDEETAAVPRLPLASCDEAVEALSGLRRSRPQQPFAVPPQYLGRQAGGVGGGSAAGYPASGHPAQESGAAGFRTSASGAPYADPAYPGAGYGDGAYVGPGYAESANVGPGYAGPANAGPGYADPAYAGAGYADGAYVRPGYADPGSGPDAGGQGDRRAAGSAGGHGPAVRRLAMVAAGMLALAGIGAVGWQVLSHRRPASPAPATQSQSGSQQPAALHVVPPVGAQAFPTSNEHANDVENTISGQGRAWTTFGYLDGPQMKQKPGTGILYDLGDVHAVGKVTVTIGRATGKDGTKAVMELRAAGPDVANARDVTAKDLKVIDTVSPTSTDVTFTLKSPVKTRFVLVWFTSLPRVGGAGDYPYRGSIGKVTVFGAS